MLAGVHLKKKNTSIVSHIHVHAARCESCPKMTKGGAHMSTWGGHFEYRCTQAIGPLI